MRYNPSLDGLRAIAVSLVMASHFSWGRLPGGWVGVGLFFVLSGFLITSILIHEKERTGTLDLRQFYIKRFLRLTPALAVVLAASLVIAAVTGKLPDAEEAAIYAATYTMNWNRALGLGDIGALGHTWSLAIEEQFYIVWPLLLLLIPKHLRMLFMLGALAALMAWRFYLFSAGASVDRIYNGFDTRAPALLIGCILAVNNKWLPYRQWLPYLFAGILGLIFLFPRVAATPLWIVSLTAVSFSSAALIKYAINDNWMSSTLSIKPLVFVGKISYGLYLWHYMLLISLSYLQNDTNRRFYVLAICGASFAAATLSYYLIERPFLRMKDRIVPAPDAAHA